MYNIHFESYNLNADIPGNFDFPFREIEKSHLICFCRDKLRHACQHFSRKSVVHFSPNLDKSVLGNFQSEK